MYSAGTLIPLLIAACMEISKDLIAASSTPIVLATLAKQENYGYAILKQVQEASAQQMTWTDGMLYPVLHRLERLGFIEGKWKAAESGRKRKYYRITASGKKQLAEELEQWRAVNETMRGIDSTLHPALLPASIR